MFSLKKAQGALEFLMTYGWAFLVILIMIGALAYFGVLSPNKFLPERCNFGSQFLCKDYQMEIDASGNAVLELQLQNNLGQAAVISAVTISSPEGLSCTVSTVSDSDGTNALNDESNPISDGEFFKITSDTCSDLGGMVEGAKYKASIDVTYYASTSSTDFSHTIQGELFSNVE